jgi:hypothetical protein
VILYSVTLDLNGDLKKKIQFSFSIFFTTEPFLAPINNQLHIILGDSIELRNRELK